MLNTVFIWYTVDAYVPIRYGLSNTYIIIAIITLFIQQTANGTYLSVTMFGVHNSFKNHEMCRICTSLVLLHIVIVNTLYLRSIG